MGDRVNSSASRDARRLGKCQFRIENRNARRRLGIKARHFLMRRFVGDQRRALTFTSSSCRGRNRDERQHRLCRFADAPIIFHRAAVGEKKIAADGGQIAEDFLKMFQYPFISGNANTALSEPYSIVLTESLAKALFGDENAMGKMVRFDNKDDLKVTGILKDVPENSTIRCRHAIAAY